MPSGPIDPLPAFEQGQRQMRLMAAVKALSEIAERYAFAEAKGELYTELAEFMANWDRAQDDMIQELTRQLLEVRLADMNGFRCTIRV